MTQESPITETTEETAKHRWYVLHVYSAFETKVMESIIETAERKNLRNLFSDFQIPTQSITQIKRGKRVQLDHRCLPGYILIKMSMNDVTWNIVKSLPKVIDFLLNDGKPQAISNAEADRMSGSVDSFSDKDSKKAAFVVGQQVCVIDGPFASFNGQVEEVDHDRERIKVSVSIFGRATPVELEYSQVEKI